MVIYIMGPYHLAVHPGAGGARTKEANIARARSVAIRLWAAGHAVICPHLNNDLEMEPEVSSKMIMAGLLKIIEVCDAVYVLRDYTDAGYAQEELTHAKKLGKTIYREDKNEPPDDR